MKRVFIACAALVSMMMVACTTNTNNTTAEAAPTVVKTNTVSDIAYIDVDFALSQSEIFKAEGLTLQKKTERTQNTWSQKEQALQADATKLQEKYQRGLITSANAQAEQEKIQQRAQEFQNLAQTELRALEEENVVFTNRTRDLLKRAVSEINSDGRYKMIVNAVSLVDADTTLNISNQVIEVLDKLYAADQAESTKK